MERENERTGATHILCDHDHVSRSRLRVDTRKWMLSKMLPKIYGDKTTTELTSPNGGPIKTETTLDEAARRIAFVLRAAVEQKEVEPK